MLSSPVYLDARNTLWEGIVLVQYEGIVLVQDESATNTIKKNRLVWKHCVQIQTLTSLCKNSTRNLYGIFYRPCFKLLYKTQSIFLTGGPIFPDNHARNVLFPFFNLSSLLWQKWENYVETVV